MTHHVKKLFAKEDLAAIVLAIKEAEKTTAGEIRVSIRQKRGWRERKLTVEQLARKEFHILRMTKTKERIGVLIFLLLQQKQFFILADEGIHTKVENGTWERIAGEMSEHFSKQSFRQGIVHGIHAVGRELSKHFPRTSSDENELSDEVHVH
jgi:uncharacterized membrane protein